MTEDGGGGVQWFISEACRAPVATDRRLLGWLMFRNEVGSDSWKSIVARLNIAASPESCPQRFNAAFTRYRVDRIRVPLQDSRCHFPGDDRNPVPRRRGLRALRRHGHRVGRPSGAVLLCPQARACALGAVVEPPGFPTAWRRRGDGGAARPTARCPKLEPPGREGHGSEIQGPENYGRPGRDWLQLDCRTWTALVRQTVPWSVDRYGWTVLERFDRLDP